MIGSSPISWLSITELETDSSPYVDNNPEVRLWLFDDPWEAPDEYEASVGIIDLTIDPPNISFTYFIDITDENNTRLLMPVGNTNLLIQIN